MPTITPVDYQMSLTTIVLHPSAGKAVTLPNNFTYCPYEACEAYGKIVCSICHCHFEHTEIAMWLELANHKCYGQIPWHSLHTSLIKQGLIPAPENYGHEIAVCMVHNCDHVGDLYCTVCQLHYLYKSSWKQKCAGHIQTFAMHVKKGLIPTNEQAHKTETPMQCKHCYKSISGLKYFKGAGGFVQACSLKCHKAYEKNKHDAAHAGPIGAVEAGIMFDKLQEAAPIVPTLESFKPKFLDLTFDSTASTPEPTELKIPKRNRTEDFQCGNLQDMSGIAFGETTVACKIPFPTAVTTKAWENCVLPSQGAMEVGESTDVRWRQILLMFRKELEKRANRHFVELPFKVYLYSGKQKRQVLYQLKAMLEMDENHKPCLTIDMAEE